MFDYKEFRLWTSKDWSQAYRRYCYIYGRTKYKKYPRYHIGEYEEVYRQYHADVKPIQASEIARMIVRDQAYVSYESAKFLVKEIYEKTGKKLTIPQIRSMEMYEVARLLNGERNSEL